MLDWLKKKGSAPVVSISIRDTLFGDASLEQWTGNKAVGEPWDPFRNAKTFLDSGKKQEAIASLRKIVVIPGLENRH